MKGIDYIIDTTTVDPVVLLMERHGMDLQTAVDTAYPPNTFLKMSNPATELYA